MSTWKGKAERDSDEHLGKEGDVVSKPTTSDRGSARVAEGRREYEYSLKLVEPSSLLRSPQTLAVLIVSKSEGAHISCDEQFLMQSDENRAAQKALLLNWPMTRSSA